ncbi:MAG TPA: DPP IV N-terminal domain-containing protein [Acidobacteriota bacterium]|nr:DPP IV N-terminal domain-containing protein [Acidobacteriota bacterium]
MLFSSRMRLAFASVLSFLFVASVVPAQERPLQLEDLYHPEKKLDFEGADLPQLFWTETGHTYFELKNRLELAAVDAETGDRSVLLNRSLLETGFSAGAGFDEETARTAAGAARILRPIRPDAVLIDWSNDLYLWQPSSKTLRRLTRDPYEEEVATLSPAGRVVAFVRKGNLFVLERESWKPRSLTLDGDETRSNGKLDWVYQEEIYGRDNYRGYWWSPDGRYIAFLQLDSSGVPEFTLVDDRERDPKLEVVRYPKAGDPNPSARLGIVRVVDGDLHWADLSAYDPADLLLVRVTWRKDGRALFLQAQNRTQTWLDLLQVQVNGKASRLLRETTSAWVNVLGDPIPLANGSFLWESERTGRRHLYLHRVDGTLERAVTKGEWDVLGVHGVDESTGAVFVSAVKENIRETHLYALSLGGETFRRLSEAPGVHRVERSPDGRFFLDTWSALDSPPRVDLLTDDGSVHTTLARREIPALKEAVPARTEFAAIPARDGFSLPVLWVLPDDFRSDRRYPVVVHTYGGPQSPVVQNRWSGRDFFWHHYLARQGFLVLLCDNRSSGSQGVREAWKIHHGLGQVELQDLEDVVTYLHSLPYVDAERIGLWGWSYGGYLTAYALTHSTSFAAGIAGAPVTDWQLYDTIYTERYMGLPRENPEGYRSSSVLAAAESLQGNLLLVYGEADDNVHPQNTRQLADRLQNLGLPFEIMTYPGERHGVRSPWKVYHLRRLMTDFFVRTLKP